MHRLFYLIFISWSLCFHPDELVWPLTSVKLLIELDPPGVGLFPWSLGLINDDWIRVTEGLTRLYSLSDLFLLDSAPLNTNCDDNYTLASLTCSVLLANSHQTHISVSMFMLITAECMSSFFITTSSFSWPGHSPHAPADRSWRTCRKNVYVKAIKVYLSAHVEEYSCTKLKTTPCLDWNKSSLRLVDVEL